MEGDSVFVKAACTTFCKLCAQLVRFEDLWVIFCLCVAAFWLQGVDGSELVYGPAAADAAGGLMEASYRNLQEARVVLQAAHALITAGGCHTLLAAGLARTIWKHCLHYYDNIGQCRCQRIMMRWQ